MGYNTKRKAFLNVALVLIIASSFMLLGLKCGKIDGLGVGGAMTTTPSPTPSASPTCTPTSTAVSQYLPTDAGYSGLVLWLKADSISGLSDGDAVSAWSDSSSTMGQFTQSTASYQPIYKIDILNCKPVVRFDGTNDQLQSASKGMISSALNGATGYTIFVVTRSVTLAGTSGYENYILGFMHSSSYVGLDLNYRNDSGNEGKVQLGGRLGAGDSAKQLVSNAAASGTTNIIIGVVDIGSDTIKLEGSASTSTTGASFVPASWVYSSTAFYDYIGTEFGRTYPFKGDLIEILLYKSVLSQQSRLELLDYLNKKYDLDV